MNLYPEHIGELHSAIQTVLNEYIISLKIEHNQIQVTVPLKNINEVLINLHSNPAFSFDQLIDLTAVDYPDQNPRFEVVYLLLSTTINQRLIVKILVSEGDLVPTSVNIYKSANWSEREIWDMFGIFFSGHPDLRRLLTDYGFEGHPLRKDFPLSGKVQVKYDNDQNRVVYEPVNLIQEYRDFDFLSPWDGVEETKNDTLISAEGDENVPK